ncbi:D-alanyl-D-alanine carboxypeptidase/D-alanyl-D-alanine endopeptidase [Arthrobacter globiformis]|uniref:D-alanyl-D-alanine carboxypeptidase/D-alanyl-D-alanine endopeptidase n=1 Tax=Arthrobacter globiformis TaxID=1665 RepID=UPI00278ECEE1|nr:D-alanyl-D-alanine carboxypeptidase/D-alanyl-D-alanine-endopeptidase [Arthrobacter globiformis]MDQ0616438.1 D-alanyl-D-alanine carboxypeptidase/D-alanyl-D-alanine-endopeptidase (penicillin-binding protein 4) [Arthrobacter globiformis]
MSSTRGTASGRGRLSTMVRSWPTLLITVLLLALALPAGLLISAALTGPARSTARPAQTPAWQLVPERLSVPQGIDPLSNAAPVPVPADVAAQLDPVLKTDGGGSFTAVVQDAATGQVLYDREGAATRIPASNMKLLTAVAALRGIGPEERFSTKVVDGPAAGATPGAAATTRSVVLVGGGDVLLGAGESAGDKVLGHAGLGTLAKLTADSLRKGGFKGQVQVLVDDSLFTGPALNPAWSPDDVAAGETAPLFPLALNSARFDPADTTAPRPQDSAIAAGEAFAAGLKAAGAAAGLTVAPAVVRLDGKPTADAKVLAEVQSATVSQQVDLMLQTSDNYLAETLGRMTAVAGGQPATNDSARAAVLGQLSGLGIPTEGMVAADVSGLALANQVSARQFSEVVRAITHGKDARLRAALAGFPVAGLTGTLGDRYIDESTAEGAGLVRAKTGTLNTVIALSGYVVDADGRLLVFSFIGNGLTPGAEGNKPALDTAATALAGCGCS